MTGRYASGKATRLPSLFSRSPWISRSAAGSVTFHPPRVEDVYALAADLRVEDVYELQASSRLTILQQIEHAVAVSMHPGAAFGPDGELLCLFGAAPIGLMDDIAAPWCLGTDHLFRFPQALAKGAQRFFLQIGQQYPRLMNYVDARNTTSIAWLRRMGFEIDEPEPFGHLKMPFHRFHKDMRNV